MDYEIIMKKIAAQYSKILSSNLVGVYLHGSFVMGGFNPKVSDIDFLVVVKEDFSNVIKRKMIDVLLGLDESSPEKGFEMSVVREHNINPVSSTIPFLLHYSDAHMAKYIEDKNYLCYGDDDPDLITHLMVIKDKGVCLYGKDINQVFSSVSKSDYVHGIMYDLEDARNGITESYEYYILNMLRTLFYLREGVISSKIEGGLWALSNVPEEFRKVIKLALNKYNDDNSEVHFDKDEVNSLLKFLFTEIDNIV